MCVGQNTHFVVVLTLNEKVQHLFIPRSSPFSLNERHLIKDDKRIKSFRRNYSFVPAQKELITIQVRPTDFHCQRDFPLLGKYYHINQILKQLFILALLLQSLPNLIIRNTCHYSNISRVQAWVLSEDAFTSYILSLTLWSFYNRTVHFVFVQYLELI